MATRLYFRPDSNPLWGTFPSGEQSTATPTWSASGATTLRTLDLQRYGAQAALSSGSISMTNAALSGFMGFFCSPPLKGSQTVGGGTMIFNTAETETSLNANFWINALNAYVWRPSTGAKVNTIKESGGTSLGGTEPTAINSEQVTHITGITSTGVTAADGDVVIVEVWSRFTPGMSGTYTCQFYYGGTTENTTEITVVSNHASFIEFTENLKFYKRAFPCT
jgi:hypothetical protein